jgi:tyrosyl-tRNA synthetase
MMVNNADWLLKLNYVEFLRDVGRHFSVNRMLSFESVKLRLEREQSLSFLEFNYMILQGYDFVELNRRYGCPADGRLGPVGQHHQRHRSRPPHGGPQLFALTSPLLTTASGAKMGKSPPARSGSTPTC